MVGGVLLEVVRKRASRCMNNGQLQSIPGWSCTLQDSGRKILGCTRVGWMVYWSWFRTPFLFGKFFLSIERCGEVLEGPGCVAGGSQKACVKIHSQRAVAKHSRFKLYARPRPSPRQVLMGLAIALAHLAVRLLPAKDAQRGVLPAWLLPSPSIQTLEGPVKQGQGSKGQGCQGSKKQGQGSRKQGRGQKNKVRGQQKQCFLFNRKYCTSLKGPFSIAMLDYRSVIIVDNYSPDTPCRE